MRQSNKHLLKRNKAFKIIKRPPTAEQPSNWIKPETPSIPKRVLASHKIVELSQRPTNPRAHNESIKVKSARVAEEKDGRQWETEANQQTELIVQAVEPYFNDSQVGYEDSGGKG